jgi:hypothetical protein
MPRPDLLAEFADADEALAAGRFLRARGSRLDLYAPYPLPGASDVIGRGRSRVPLATFLGGFGGGVTGYLVQWWCTSVDYPLRVGGFPAHPALAFVPITFESLVIGACLAATAAALFGSGLPRLWHPAFAVDGFERASIDRFFLEIADEQADPGQMRAELARYGVLRVVELEPG